MNYLQGFMTLAFWLGALWTLLVGGSTIFVFIMEAREGNAFPMGALPIAAGIWIVPIIIVTVICFALASVFMAFSGKRYDDEGYPIDEDRFF